MPRDPFSNCRWLPPDTETAEAHFARIAEFHRQSAQAFWRGPEHVACEKAREAAARAALQSVESALTMKLSDDDVKRIADAVAERLLSKDALRKVAEAALNYILWAGLGGGLLFLVFKHFTD